MRLRNSHLWTFCGHSTNKWHRISRINLRPRGITFLEEIKSYFQPNAQNKKFNCPPNLQGGMGLPVLAQHTSGRNLASCSVPRSLFLLTRFFSNFLPSFILSTQASFVFHFLSRHFFLHRKNALKRAI